MTLELLRGFTAYFVRRFFYRGSPPDLSGHSALPLLSSLPEAPSETPLETFLIYFYNSYIFTYSTAIKIMIKLVIRGEGFKGSLEMKLSVVADCYIVAGQCHVT